MQALREERTDLIAAMESSSRKSDQFRDDMMRLQVENDELKSTITKLKQIADEVCHYQKHVALVACFSTLSLFCN